MPQQVDDPGLLAARHAKQIIAFIAERGHPASVATLLALISIAGGVFYFWRWQGQKEGMALR